MTISPIALIIALAGATSLGVILCILFYSLREISGLKRELVLRGKGRISTPPPFKSNVCEPKRGPMYYVEKYMTDHQFPEDDKKKVRDFLSQKQFEHAFFTDANLHYTRGGSEYIVSRSMLGLQDNFV